MTMNQSAAATAAAAIYAKLQAQGRYPTLDGPRVTFTAHGATPSRSYTVNLTCSGPTLLEAVIRVGDDTLTMSTDRLERVLAWVAGLTL